MNPLNKHEHETYNKKFEPFIMKFYVILLSLTEDVFEMWILLFKVIINSRWDSILL